LAHHPLPVEIAPGRQIRITVTSEIDRPDLETGRQQPTQRLIRPAAEPSGVADQNDRSVATEIMDGELRSFGSGQEQSVSNVWLSYLLNVPKPNLRGATG
jgi:hypothetical protein